MPTLRIMKKALKLTNIVKLINFTLETNIGWLSFLPFLFRVLSNYIWTLWTLLPSFTWFLGPEFEGTLLRTLTLTWEHTNVYWSTLSFVVTFVKCGHKFHIWSHMSDVVTLVTCGHTSQMW